LGQPRSTQRYVRKISDEEEKLVDRIVSLALQYGRYGYRRITALLGEEGWWVNHKRVERIWEAGGVESAAETAKEETVVVDRRILYPASSREAESRLEL
jgi:putative transposase